LPEEFYGFYEGVVEGGGFGVLEEKSIGSDIPKLYGFISRSSSYPPAYQD